VIGREKLVASVSIVIVCFMCRVAALVFWLMELFFRLLIFILFCYSIGLLFGNVFLMLVL